MRFNHLPFTIHSSQRGSVATLLILIIVIGSAIYFSGFFTFREYEPNPLTKKYVVVEDPNSEKKDVLNIIKLELKEYTTPTLAPTIVVIPPTSAPVTPPPPAPTKPPKPTPTIGPTRTPAPTRPPTPIPPRSPG